MKKTTILTIIIASVFMLAPVFGQVYPEGMVSYWKLDEGSGTIATDSVGTNDGTLVNGPVWVSGQVNGALNFDGVDDYVLLPDIDLVPSPFTICAWVNIQDNTLPGSHHILKKKTKQITFFISMLYATLARFGKPMKPHGQTYQALWDGIFIVALGMV
jgi:hypothetical protein